MLLLLEERVMLEQLYSPLIVAAGTLEHEELKWHRQRSYAPFAGTSAATLALPRRSGNCSTKTSHDVHRHLLYAFRVLLTSIH